VWFFAFGKEQGGKERFLTKEEIGDGK